MPPGEVIALSNRELEDQMEAAMSDGSGSTIRPSRRSTATNTEQNIALESRIQGLITDVIDMRISGEDIHEMIFDTITHARQAQLNLPVQNSSGLTNNIMRNHAQPFQR